MKLSATHTQQEKRIGRGSGDNGIRAHATYVPFLYKIICLGALSFEYLFIYSYLFTNTAGSIRAQPGEGTAL